MKTATDRHAILIAAGWAYEAHHDMYRRPGDAGATATRYNLAAAWDAHTCAAAPTQPKIADPRRSQPL